MADKNIVSLLAEQTPPPKRVYRRGRPACRYCGVELVAGARGRGACDAPDCRKKDRRLRGQIRREKDEIEVVAMRAAAARALERVPSGPALAVEEIAATCHFSAPLVALEREEVDAFRTSLEHAIRITFIRQDDARAQGVELAEEDDGSTPLQDGAVAAELVFKIFESRDVLEQPAHPAQSAACAACRGRCCERGTENLGYIRPADIARFRRRNPDATPASMVDAYLAQLPSSHVRNSCVFHGPVGCSLPRDMRSTFCNGFKCHWLHRIDDMIAAGAPPRLVAGFEAHRPRKAFLIEEDGSLVETPVDSSINSEDLLAEAAVVARGEPSCGEADQTSFPESSEAASLGGGTGS